MSGSGSGTGGSCPSAKTTAASGKVPPRNAPGSRTDVAWQHGYSIEGSTKKIKCKYCEKELSGGVYRLKHHLAQTQKDVEPCRAVPDDVQKQMLDIVMGLQVKLRKKDLSATFQGDDPISKRQRLEAESGSGSGGSAQVQTTNIFRRQATIPSIVKKPQREDACQAIARFFYNNAIPFNAANSEEYLEMFEKVARHGLGFKPPSYYELRVQYLKQEVKACEEAMEEHKEAWKTTGCTIMTDGWTDRRRRTLINFLVNSPKGTVFLRSFDASHVSKTADKIFKMIDEVIEEVGEENVVQVVTDNAANYKAAGEMLMEKRRKLYWTPCAAHCIDLMLEDFEKKLPIQKDTIAKGKKITTYIYSRTSLISMLQHFSKGKDLIRPGMTRFATSYLTLGYLNDNKGALVRMFTSKEWKSTQMCKTKDGKYMEDVVMDRGFWKNVVICLRGSYPLIKVLRLVDADDPPAMGFIYEEMDKAKEKIQSAFNGSKKSYQPLWDIIDERWDKQLHRPLHAAGYYLNPKLHYAPGFKADFEVKKGLYDCMQMMIDDTDTVTKIDAQLEDFKKKKFFGSLVAKNVVNTKAPADWWESYGDEHPELQQFAIRVLSLTCSSSGCERNWSAFERVHTKKRNRLKQKTMNDVVYVMANSKLAKKKNTRKGNVYDVDDLSSDDEWIVDAQNLDEEEDDEHVQVGEEEASGVGGGIGDEEDDDLAIPNFDDLDEQEVEENEDEMQEDDAGYYDQNLDNLLD